MRIIVNELLRLWKEGVIVKTHKYPLGRLVRLILVALVCDKPVVHKLGGFGLHSHHFFCTRCWGEPKKILAEQYVFRDAPRAVQNIY